MLHVDDSHIRDAADAESRYDRVVAASRMTLEHTQELWVERWSDLSDVLQDEIRIVKPMFMGVDHVTKDEYFMFEAAFKRCCEYGENVDLLAGLANIAGIDYDESDVFSDYVDSISETL